MEFITTDLETNVFIQSEAEFSQAKRRGLRDKIISLITGRRLHLLSLNPEAVSFHPNRPTDLGLQDIPIKQIVGSVSRCYDFTSQFLPRGSIPGVKERWRRIYTLAATGQGFPPIEVYKMGECYFVKDGHHRVSVAKYLAWETIQAKVTILKAADNVSMDHDPAAWYDGNCLCLQA